MHRLRLRIVWPKNSLASRVRKNLPGRLTPKVLFNVRFVEQKQRPATVFSTSTLITFALARGIRAREPELRGL